LTEILYTLILGIAFIIPGFIITSIKNKIIPTQNKEYKVKIVEFFVYSFVNLFLWGMPLCKMYKNINWYREHYCITWGILLLIIFVTPIVISGIVVFINKKDVIRKFLSKISINVIEAEPTAWDFKFANMEVEWVIVTLNNNKTVAGYMDDNSCASSNENDRDLYIKEVYKIDDNGKWKRVENTDGILIKAEQVKYIEFFKTK